MDGIGGLQGGLQARGILGQQAVNRAGDIQRRAGDNLEHATKELEIVFSTMMVKEMRKTLSDGLFGKGPGVDTFEGWFDDHVGRSIAAGGALELSGLLKTAAGVTPTPKPTSEGTE